MRGFNGKATIYLNNRDVPHLLGHKRTNLVRFLDAGLSISWETAHISPGTFIIKTGQKKASGTIFDALSEMNR